MANLNTNGVNFSDLDEALTLHLETLIPISEVVTESNNKKLVVTDCSTTTSDQRGGCTVEMGHVGSPVKSQRKSLGQAGIMDFCILQINGLVNVIEFEQLEELQESENNPNFMEDSFGLFFRDAPQIIAHIENGISNGPPENYQPMYASIHRLKGSSGTIGAKKVYDAISLLEYHIREGNTKNIRGATESTEVAKQELAILQDRLKTYFELLKQAKAASPKRSEGNGTMEAGD
ncbi:hypothetical protein ACFE04_014250 [Oxalis oulophora]